MTKNLRNFTRYSGIAFQMLAIILFGVWGGKKLDERLGYENPTWLIVCSLVAVVLSMYFVIKDILRMSENDKKKE